MTPDTYIASGILELYVAGVLPEEEREKVEKLAANNTNVQEEIKRIEATITEYAQLQTPNFDADAVYEKIKLKLDEPLPPPVETISATSAKPKIKQKPQQKPVAMPQQEVTEKPEPKRIVVEGSRRSFAGAFAFTLLLLLLSVLGNFYLYNDWLATREAYNELHSQNITLTENLEKVNKQQQAFSGNSIYADPAYKIITLTSTDAAVNAQVRVFYNMQSKHVMAKPMQLPKPAEGKAYQLWAVNAEGKPVDMGMLKMDEDSGEYQNMKIVESATKFAVTIEPENGSAQPTSDPVFVSAAI